MKHAFHWIGVTLAVLGWATLGWSATAEFDIVPASNPDALEVVAAPGETVDYEITVVVTSDDLAALDNNGLAYFKLDMLTNLNLAQVPPTEFAPGIDEVFTLLQSLGEVSEDDILGISGSQDTVTGTGTLTPAVALDSIQVLAMGSLTLPEVEGTYTVIIGPEPRANVFLPESLTQVLTATTAIGPGFTVMVTTNDQTDTSPDATDGTDTTSDTTANGDTTTGDDQTDSSPATENADDSTDTSASTMNPIVSAILAMAAAAAITAGATMMFGPIIGALALVGSLLMLIFLALLGS